MGLLGDITAYIDNLKRRGSNTLADLATNPLGLLSRNLSAFSESLPAAPDSVMPDSSGLLNRPGFQQWGMDVALNAPTMGLLGQIVYHGSPKKFGSLDAGAPKTTSGGLINYGSFVSPDQSVAERYAKDFGGNGGGYVYKIEDNVLNPLRLSSREQMTLQKIVGKIDNGKALSELDDVGLEMLMNKAGIDWVGLGRPHPIDAIRRAGYDAIEFSGGPEAEKLLLSPDKSVVLSVKKNKSR